MSPFESKFADAGLRAASNYDRKFRRYAPFSEIIDTLRRQAAFDLPLKFVLDRDSESAGFFKRGPQWDFGSSGVRFGKREAEESYPVLVVTWSDDFEQKTLQDVVVELNGLGLCEDALVTMELVSPEGERKLSKYGNRIMVDKKDNTLIHFTGAWQE